MPRSLAHGDYSLLVAVESSSRPDSWYRVLADRQNGALSCDCPPWTFNHQQDAAGHRSCQHTDIGMLLTGAAPTPTPLPARARTRPNAHTAATHPLIAATQEQWPGLRGTWSIEERDSSIGGKPYHFVLLRLALGNGGQASAAVAFARRHQPTLARMQAAVAGWAGYAIAAEVARLGGFPLVGQPPEHFRVDRTRATGTGRPRPAQAPAPAQAGRARPQAAPVLPRIGLADILRVGDRVDLGDGLRPEQRAENTLRLFLGEQVYAQLEQQHFLDVSSVRYAAEQRVYRLRRDPAHRNERRVRIFERGQYVRDYCIVRGMECPEGDHFLTVFLSLLSDEEAALSVVQRYNIFSPYSDGNERETIPARWQPRAASPTPVG